MKAKKQFRIKMSFLRKSKLFQREKMQSLKGKDFLKVAVIVGIIVIPLVFGLVV